MNDKREEQHVDETQLHYADILHWVAIIGFVFLILTFGLYVSGTLPSLVNPSEVPQMWHLQSEAFLQQTGLSTGWEWVEDIAHGDILTFASLIFLASGTIICFAITLVIFIKKKEWAYTVFVALEIVVLLTAASGLVAGGH